MLGTGTTPMAIVSPRNNMLRWQYTYNNGQVHSRGHGSYQAALNDALSHQDPGYFTVPTSYEVPDEPGYPEVDQIPLLSDPRVKVEVEYRQYLKVTYPPEMRGEMLYALYEVGGFQSGGYSGPIHHLIPDYDPKVSQRREVVYREFIP